MKMFMRLILIVVGVIVALAGTVFTFQGVGQIGPSSSFMYRNPDWTGYGAVIALVGVLVAVLGILTSRRH